MRHALAVLTIAASAALTPERVSAQAPPPVAAPADGTTVTVTGCLARGDSGNGFVLKNVTWKPTSLPTAETGHQHGAPTTAPPTAASTPETLKLAGAAPTLKLDAHVGHIITATGTIAKRDPVVTPGVVLPDPQPQGDTTSRKAGEAEAARAKAAASLRTLDMKTMSHVAPACQ